MNKVPFYTVVEKQISSDGTPGILTSHFDYYEQALSSCFTICAAAAISAIPYHAAHIIRDDGIMIEGRVFDRRIVPAPENGGEE